MLKVYVAWQNFVRRQGGQALSEYGLVIALVAVAAIGGLIAFRGEIQNTLAAMTEGMRSR
jgi:Flp pilus assembly pilin Flp